MPGPGYDPEKNRESCRLYREKNRDRLLAAQRAKHLANRAENNAKRAARLAAVPAAERAAYRRAWSAGRRARYPWERLLRSAEARAKSKGLPFALTREWAEARWTGSCEISGIPFVIENTGRSGPKFFSPSIDQISPKAGYTPTNCRIVLWAVNAMKHTGSDEDMLLVARAIVKNFPPKA